MHNATKNAILMDQTFAYLWRATGKFIVWNEEKEEKRKNYCRWLRDVKGEWEAQTFRLFRFSFQ